MNPEKTHLYKKQYQQPIEEETPPHKVKSKTAATSDSRKRSKHKHIYKKIILYPLTFFPVEKGNPQKQNSLFQKFFDFP